VTPVRSSQIEVYLFRRRGRGVEFLTLRRAGHKAFPHVWQPVTGKLKRGEGTLEGAQREVLEETGLEPRRWWALETVTVYFDPAGSTVRLLPLFAAEIGAGDRPRLSAEHDDHRFLSAREAARRYLWLSQVRALDAVRREVLGGGRRARALEVTERVGRGGTAHRPKRIG
jgi:8-oxo-dGTP pyrophosphatase MutT (NUDIX family)